MASQYKRILDPRVLTADMTQPATDIWDAGAYRTLEVQARVVKAGTAGYLKIQHAAVNEEDAFRDLTGGNVGLSAVDNIYFSATGFLRYVRWVTDGAVTGSPVALVDVIAKE